MLGPLDRRFEMSSPIIVGVDGPDARAAATLAASLAPRLGRELVLAHVAPDPPVFPYGDRRLKELQRREAIADGVRLLTDVADAVDASSAERVVVLGPPAERLASLAESREADLLVVGSRARPVLARALLGGVSGSLAATSPCPVLVVPNDLDDKALRDAVHGPLLLGADGTRSANRAGSVAAYMADRLDTSVLPVRIKGPQETGDQGTPIGSKRRDVAGRLAGLAERLDMPLLVVGTRGGGWLSGSVAQRLIATASVPVVVVPRSSVSDHELAHAA
jgi:nucleotide-binding universal stress UspA family protein